MATNGRSFTQPLLSLLGLFLVVMLVWFFFGIIKGILGAILSILLVAIAAVVVWRLVKAGVYKR